MTTLTAGEVMNHARDMHPSLSPQNAPRPVLLRALNRSVRSLYDDIFPRFPGLLAQTITISTATLDWDRVTEDGFVRVTEGAPSDAAAGIDLATYIPGGWVDLLTGEFWYSLGDDARGPVQATFVPYEQANRPAHVPAFTLRGNVLFFCGTAQMYSNFAAFRLTYTGLPADLVQDTDVIALPLDAREPLAQSIAAFALGRLVGNPQWEVTPEAVDALEQRAAQKRAEFLKRVYRGTQRQVYHMRDVRADPGGPWFP